MSYLPSRIGLCPDESHSSEFCIHDPQPGEKCPSPGCHETLVVYALPVDTSSEIVNWLMHIDRLDEIAGARMPLPHYNPLWDAAIEIARKYGVKLRGGRSGSM